jgi:hypothetical protein
MRRVTTVTLAAGVLALCAGARLPLRRCPGRKFR